MKKHKRPTILYVEWIDSASSSGWQTKQLQKQNLGCAGCSSCGFFVKETKHTLTLALNRGAYLKKSCCGVYGEFISIPKVVITKRKVIVD